MELRQLEYFLIIAEEKSFARAANKIFVSQQALSKSVQNLEKDLGVALFERSSVGVEPTPQGTALMKKAYQIKGLVDGAIEEMNATNHQTKNPVNFGIPYSILDLFDLDSLFSFQIGASNREIRIREVPDKGVMNGIYYNLIDAGIVGSKADFTNYDVHLLNTSSTYIAAHKDSKIARSKRGRVKLEDLRHEVFITATKDYNCYGTFVSACTDCGFTPNIGQQSGNINLIRQFVKMQQGIYPCPGNRKHYMEDSNIVFLELTDAPPIYQLYLLTRKDKHLTKNVREFCDHVIAIAPRSEI